MRAGRLRHRISIERRGAELDSFREPAAVWSPIVSRCCARVRDDSQREFTANLQAQADKTVHFEIRHPRVQITAKDRVTWHAAAGDKRYDIKAVLENENTRKELTIICVEHA